MNKIKLTLYVAKAILITIFTTIFILGVDSIIRVSKNCSKWGLSDFGLDTDITLPATFLIVSYYFYRIFTTLKSKRVKYIAIAFYLIALFLGYWISGIIGMIYIVGTGVDSL
jgi:hypothetical protein